MSIEDILKNLPKEMLEGQPEEQPVPVKVCKDVFITYLYCYQVLTKGKSESLVSLPSQRPIQMY